MSPLASHRQIDALVPNVNAGVMPNDQPQDTTAQVIRTINIFVLTNRTGPLDIDAHPAIEFLLERLHGAALGRYTVNLTTVLQHTNMLLERTRAMFMQFLEWTRPVDPNWLPHWEARFSHPLSTVEYIYSSCFSSDHLITMPGCSVPAVDHIIKRVRACHAILYWAENAFQGVNFPDGMNPRWWLGQFFPGILVAKSE